MSYERKPEVIGSNIYVIYANIRMNKMLVLFVELNLYPITKTTLLILNSF